MGADDHAGQSLEQKTQTCLTLLTPSILANGIASLDDLEATPMVLVSGIF